MAGNRICGAMRTMTIDEAIDICGVRTGIVASLGRTWQRRGRIEHELATCGYNWLTGQTARDVLRQAVDAQT